MRIEKDGTVVVAGAFQPGGNVTAGGNLALSATNTIYLDGNGGHTFISEYSANKIQLQAGGQGSVILDGTNSGVIRMGIGTSSPSTGLHLTGGDNTASKLTLTNTAPSPDNSWSLHPEYNSQNLTLNEDSTTRVTFESGGNIVLGTDQAVISTNTSDGSDDRTFCLAGGGSCSTSRGSVIVLCGNEDGNDGKLLLYAGNAGNNNGMIHFYTGNSVHVGKFDYNGDFYSNDGTIHNLSDKRGKKDIQDLSDGLDIVKKLKPVTYKWNGKADMGEDDDVTRYGFVADDVLEVASQYVGTTKAKLDGEDVDDYKTISMLKMFPMLIKAVQELSAELQELSAELQDTKDYVDHKQDYNSMAGRINSCEARIGHLEKK